MSNTLAHALAAIQQTETVLVKFRYMSPVCTVYTGGYAYTFGVKTFSEKIRPALIKRFAKTENYTNSIGEIAEFSESRPVRLQRT